MDIKKFVLSHYRDASDNFYIHRIDNPVDTLQPHCHDYYQAFYVLSGSLVHHVGEGSATLSAGDLFILPPSVPHYIEAEPGAVDFYSLSFLPSFLNGVRESNKLIADLLQYLNAMEPETLHLRLTLSGEDVIFVKTMFQRIFTEFHGNGVGKEAVIQAYVSVLLALFTRIYFEEQAQPIAFLENKKAVYFCIDYIENHFDENLTLEEMVHRSAMSKTCFCRLFREIAGSSFKQYLNAFRIKKAAALLKNGTDVSTAGMLCGYNDFSTFYRNFVKLMDIPPSQYQSLYCSDHQ